MYTRLKATVTTATRKRIVLPLNLPQRVRQKRREEGKQGRRENNEGEEIRTREEGKETKEETRRQGEERGKKDAGKEVRRLQTYELSTEQL